MDDPISGVGLAVISRAVTEWLRFYEVAPEDRILDVLTRAAREHYAEGYRRPDELATYLIGRYVGRWSLVSNAPTSASVH